MSMPIIKPFGVTKCQSVTDIMESIALEQTALSHILNAEGEKLQQAIASTNDIEKLLCVNQSVNQTIIYITHLEQVLYAKLSALTSCPCSMPCPSPCECPVGCPCKEKCQCKNPCAFCRTCKHAQYILN